MIGASIMKELKQRVEEKKVKRNEINSVNEKKKHLLKMPSFESSLLKTMKAKRHFP